MPKRAVVGILFAVALQGGAWFLHGPALAAEEPYLWWGTCQNAQNLDARIAACTRIIELVKQGYYKDWAWGWDGGGAHLPTAYYHRGRTYQEQGDTRRALEDYRWLADQCPVSWRGTCLRSWNVKQHVAALEAKLTPPSRSNPPPNSTAPVPSPQPPKIAGTSPVGGGATIKVDNATGQNGQEVRVITLEGPLTFGDDKRFAAVAIGASSAIVVLNSPGGSVAAGIGIGTAIRLLGFSTLVPEGLQCASACALAWLGGTPRFMGRGATIGFHAAFVTENGQDTVSSAGNALVGAYLNQLGLSMQAITYITEKQPADIQWLTFDDAATFGIEVSKVPPG